MIKARIKSLLGPQIMGALEYYRFPEKRVYRGSAFNHQSFRKLMFKEIVTNISFDRIYETGTYRGTTTEYMADVSGLHVYTVEVFPKHYGFTRARFWFNRFVHVHSGDSRKFLEQQLASQVGSASQADTADTADSTAPVFAYLDAHWKEDLPLLEECRILLGNRRPCVVMIDDFEVPDDPGYRFDDYGPGKCLTPEYLEPIANLHHGLFFPAAPSQNETSDKRGCVVLSNDVELTKKLHAMSTMRTLLVGIST